MSFANLTQKSRTSLARTLAKFFAENADIEIKHALANRAIAALFGHNEHSIAAAIRDDNDGQSRRRLEHKCSVPNCTNTPAVEVRLFDIYLNSSPIELFDEIDHTCPYLCETHLKENESKAIGERRPRGSVHYPHSNKGQAQGYTIYRPLATNIIESNEEENTPSKPGWTIQNALEKKSITLVRRKDNVFHIRLGILKTEIRISLYEKDGGTGFGLSHVIKTPEQIGPYRPGRPWGDDPGYALHLALSALTQYYDSAVDANFIPQENWLYPY